MNPRASCLACCALVASCASYEPPPGASVHIELAGPVTTVFVSDGRNCSSRRPVPRAQWQDLQVDANKTVAVELWFRHEFSNGSTWCQGALELTPAYGARYRLTFVPSFKDQFLSGCGIRTETSDSSVLGRESPAVPRQVAVLSCAN